MRAAVVRWGLAATLLSGCASHGLATNAELSRFVAEGGYESRELWTDAGWRWRTRERVTGPSRSQARHPFATNLSWYEARALCALSGRTLPPVDGKALDVLLAVAPVERLLKTPRAQNLNSATDDYTVGLKNAIGKRWRYPCIPIGAVGRCTYVSTFLVTEFGIAKSGDLAFVDVLVPSEEPLMDDAAVSAIRSAAPFAPVPDTLRKEGVPILATFSYVVEHDESPAWEWMTVPDTGRSLSTPGSRDVWSSLQPVRHRPSGTLRLAPSSTRVGAIGVRCVDH